MFGNLKNKIGEVADLKKYATPQNLANSLLGSRQRSGTITPSIGTPSVPQSPNPVGQAGFPASVSTDQLSGRATTESKNVGNHYPHHPNNNSIPQSNSTTSLPSFSHSPLSPASSRSHSRQTSITSPPLSPGQSPTPSRQDAGNGRATPTGPVNMASRQQVDPELLSREVEKLRQALEQQQDAHLSRLAAKETEWREKFSRHADKVSHTQEALQKSEITIASLRKQVDTYKDRNEGLLRRLEAIQDDCDQREGLSVQEAAKIKHMLLQTSADLEAANTQLHERTAEHAALEAVLRDVQGDKDRQVQQLQEQVHHLQQEVRQLEQCRQQQLRSVPGVAEGSEDDSRLQELQRQHADREQALLAKVEECREQCSQQAEQLVSVQLALAQQRQQSEQQLLSEQQRADSLLADERAMCERRLSESTTRFEEQRLALEAESKRQEEERRQQDEVRRRQETQAHEAAKAEWQRKERELTEQLTQVRQERDQVRWQQETAGQKDDETIQALRQQLAQASSRSQELERQVTASTGGQRETASRCDQLQGLLDTAQAQVTSEHENSERLQVALSSERSEKQWLESAKAELEAKLQAYSSEKSKLSQHLDSFAAKVTALEQRSTEEQLLSAKLQQTVDHLEKQLQQSKDKLYEHESGQLAAQQRDRSDKLQELEGRVSALQDELDDKKQALRVQTQRMADMKKTMQRELRISPDQVDHTIPAQSSRPGTDNHASSSSNNVSSPAVLSLNNAPSRAGAGEVPAITRDGPVDPINLEYLKHVVLKFVTSREYEAIHLTKAVSTLLHLTSQEERLLHDTLSWKMSWFGTKPQLVPENE